MLETQRMGGAFTVNIPYRCLLPKGLEGLLVTGLGISVHRDAVTLVRMQACIQNQGYAAGLAAATAAREASPLLRAIDVKGLQRKLVELGYLPEEVLDQGEVQPMSREAIAQAVREDPGNTAPRRSSISTAQGRCRSCARRWPSSEGPAR